MADLGYRLVAACRQLAADLTAVGIPADVERTRVRAPGAWITPQSVDITTLAGGGTARVHVVLVAPDNGEFAALEQLAELLDQFLATGHCWADGETVDTAWAAVIGPNSSPVPAFRIPVDLDL